METNEQKVKRWLEKVDALKAAKTAEADLRRELAGVILGDKVKGAKKGKIGPYILTATGKVNQKVDKEALKAIWSSLKPEEKAAIKFDPKVVAAEYKKLPGKSKLNQVITEKPGMPGLELKEVLGD